MQVFWLDVYQAVGMSDCGLQGKKGKRNTEIEHKEVVLRNYEEKMKEFELILAGQIQKCNPSHKISRYKFLFPLCMMLFLLVSSNANYGIFQDIFIRQNSSMPVLGGQIMTSKFYCMSSSILWIQAWLMRQIANTTMTQEF